MKTRKPGNLRMISAGKGVFRTFLAGLPTPTLPSHLRIRSEQGKSLPAALITLAVGSLLLTPFLAFVSSRSLGSRSAESAIAAQYAADAGIEFGIWSLLNDAAFRSQVDNNLGIAQPLAFPGTLNSFTPTISVTGLPIGTWTIRQSAPTDVNRGGALAYAGGDRIYALRGDNSSDFGYYSISGNSWSSLANTPQSVQQGGALAYGGGNFLYALRGSNSDAFWQYNIAADIWITLEPTPNNVRQGGELVWTGGDDIYAFGRNNNNDFWHYSISSDSWTDMADTPATVGYGSDLVYTGGNSIYAFCGNNQTFFWRYNISSDSWSSLANAPASVTDGGGLAYHSGSYIYALSGGGNVFWRYTIGTNTWSVLTSTPAAVGRGGDLLFTQATVGFAQRGGNQPDFWEFEVTPPRFDIHTDAGPIATDVRIEIDGLNTSVLFWDIN
jgi:hypothetical protein